MVQLVGLMVGQSNALGFAKSNNGSRFIHDDWRYTWNCDVAEFGDAFVAPAWGQHPLNSRAGQNPYANNLMQGFTERVGKTVASVHVCAGGHPMHCFIRKGTRAANGWPEVINPPLYNLAPFIFDQTNGVRKALNVVERQFLDFVMIHQGEANAGTSEDEFFNMRKAFIDDLFTVGLINGQTAILDGWLAEGVSNRVKHQNVCNRLKNEFDNYQPVSSDGLDVVQDSPLHLTGEALLIFGRRYANKYLDMTSL